MLFIHFTALFIWSSSDIYKPATVITGVHATWISKGYILLSGSLITQAPWKTKFKSDVNGFQSSADLCIQLSSLKPNGKMLWLRKLYMKFTSAIRKRFTNHVHLKRENSYSFSNLLFPPLSDVVFIKWFL